MCKNVFMLLHSFNTAAKNIICRILNYSELLGFRARQHQVIGVRNEMIMDDYYGQMMFGDLVGLKIPDIRLTGGKPRKNLTQETCPNRESNPGPLRGKRACNHLLHSGGL